MATRQLSRCLSRKRDINLVLGQQLRAISRNTTPKASAAPVSRPLPAPSFNTQDAPSEKITPLHPLKTQPTKFDDSFVGLSGGQIFHEMMLRQGVKHIFGYPGGAILPVFDAIYNSPYFDFILPRHEQGAGHMAEGYARASGKPGVVLVTSGPGVTNVVTAMQDALSDGTALVVFSGQVPTSAIGTDAFQEADVVGISRSCTKWNVMVKNIGELPRRINEAFEIATTGRPGPVLVDLPKDVTVAILRNPIPTKAVIPGTYSSSSTIHGNHQQIALENSIRRVARLVNISKKPVIFVGQGILAKEEGPILLRELAEKAQIPVTTSLQGLGAFDERDEKSLHMLGMHGSAYANMAMQEADLILTIGARFDDRTTGNLAQFAPQARAAALQGRGGIVHFEIMPKNINKVVQATEAVEGDASESLSMLLPHVEHVDKSVRTEWFAQIAEWKRRFPFTYTPSQPGEKIKPQALIEMLSHLTEPYKKNVIITTGVGAHQMWAAQHFRWTHPRTCITSGGLGTMGYGLPSAIGAKIARPEAVVVDIDGDASFSMTAMELATASQFKIGIKVLIVNNEFQGMIKQWQDVFYDKRYSHSIQVNPDFVRLAESMGVKGIRLTKQEELEEKMKEFLEYNDGPIVMDAVVTKSEHVLPMVPAGRALHQFILHESLKNA